MEDLEEDRNLGPHEAAGYCDFLCMHGYPMYAKWLGSNTEEALLPFLGLITRWLGEREVLFEEFGASTRPESKETGENSDSVSLTESEAAAFTRRALRLLKRTGFLGAMLWCFGDYDRKLWSLPPFDVAPHERFFGLLRSDRSPKPALSQIRTLGNVSVVEPDLDWIDMDRELFYRAPLENLKRLYGRFRSVSV
jgi:endo-1,4-beta-mannosidase